MRGADEGEGGKRSEIANRVHLTVLYLRDLIPGIHFIGPTRSRNGAVQAAFSAKLQFSEDRREPRSPYCGKANT